MIPKFCLCQSCGLTWWVTQTHFEEWSIRPSELVLETKWAQKVSPQNILDYITTGEFQTDWEVVQTVVGYRVSASKPICPISSCLGNLAETYVIQL